MVKQREVQQGRSEAQGTECVSPHVQPCCSCQFRQRASNEASSCISKASRRSAAYSGSADAAANLVLPYTLRYEYSVQHLTCDYSTAGQSPTVLYDGGGVGGGRGRRIRGARAKRIIVRIK